MKKYKNFLLEYTNIKPVKLDDSDIIKVNSLKELYTLLEKHNIDLSIWSTGPYKSVEHLWKELEEGECQLYNFENAIRREVNFVGAKIIYIDGNKKYKLAEDKAIFKDGRVRERNIWYSMAEKFKFGEDPKEAFIRGMKEELNIDVNDEQFFNFNKIYFPSDGDYPGINSFHTGYGFFIVFNEEQYDKNGYIEHQEDKDIYFNWKEIKYME